MFLGARIALWGWSLMWYIIKMELNLNQTVITFNKATNTDRAVACAHHIPAVLLLYCWKWERALWQTKKYREYRGRAKASKHVFCGKWLGCHTLSHTGKHTHSGLARAGLTSGHNGAVLWKAIFHDVSHWLWHEPWKIQLSLELSVISFTLSVPPHSLSPTCFVVTSQCSQKSEENRANLF